MPPSSSKTVVYICTTLEMFTDALACLGTYFSIFLCLAMNMAGADRVDHVHLPSSILPSHFVFNSGSKLISKKLLNFILSNFYTVIMDTYDFFEELTFFKNLLVELGNFSNMF
jgi:hypothetical protein